MKNGKILQKRRDFVKKFVKEQHQKGIKIQSAIYDLSESLFLSPRQIENDLYFKKDKTPKPNKHKY